MLQVTQGLEGFEAKALKALTMFSNSVKVLQQFSKCFRVPFSSTSRASYCHSFLLNFWTVRKLGWVFLFWAASGGVQERGCDISVWFGFNLC